VTLVLCFPDRGQPLTIELWEHTTWRDMEGNTRKRNARKGKTWKGMARYGKTC
jgi:hypothetical protein